MATEIIEKRKGMMSCAECGEEMSAGMTECPECGSENVKKSIVIVRKETADVDDELDSEVEDEEDEDEDDDEDDDEENDEDDEEEGDEEEGEDDEEETPPVVKSLKGNEKKVAFIEALNLSTALAEGITKILSGKISKASDSYEEVMTEFNSVMDTAFDNWVSGSTVSKTGNVKEQTTLINNRVNNIMKEGGAIMPKTNPRPESLDSLELPDDIKVYIASLEGDVEKSGEEDIYKGLTPQAAKIVKKAAETNEAAETQRFVDLAKSYTHIPGDKTELAKSLRLASETSSVVFKNLTETLAASNENLKQSDIFKSYGLPNNGGDKVSKRHTEAESLVEKGLFKTVEQAEVSLMGGEDYVPSTVAAN